MKTKNKALLVLIVIMLIGFIPGVFAAGKTEAAPKTTAESAMGTETAVFAGGCFWGVEGVFERLKGVENVVSGYSGGNAEDAHYQTVGTGKTGHAESVRIEYDPDTISFEKLLEIFFTVAHNPTELNFQGPDVGSEYRSVVFYKNEVQKKETEQVINELEKKDLFNDPIVTEVVPLDGFYPAEDYHQDYLVNNPNQPYIVFWDMPKIKNLEAMYPELIKDGM